LKIYSGALVESSQFDFLENTQLRRVGETTTKGALIMNKVKIYAVALAITLVGLTAFAQDKPPVQKAGALHNEDETAMDRDMAKVSKDGYLAIRDVSMARLAIFNGQPAQAKTYTNDAQAALERAKRDDTAFTKAESELKTPAGMTQPGSSATPSTTHTTWIPVDGSITLGEDYIDTPEKSAGVAKANEELKKGEHKHAMETLKLADINVSFVMEVAPLDKTTAGIKNAAQLIEAGKYYEANQALKDVEDGFRFDVTEADATPKKAANNTSKTAASSASVQKQ
jgi:hypothetical protein